MRTRDIDDAANLFRQGVYLMDEATDLDGLITARTALINGMFALLDVAHQGGAYLQHLEREIAQLVA